MKKPLFTLVLLMVATVSIGQSLCFDPTTDTRYEAGNGTQAIAKADFNEDNHLDVVAANYLDWSVSIFLGNGDGTFQSQIVVADLMGGAEDVKVGDFNSDNHVDIVVCLRGGSENLALITGNGDGTFNTAQFFELGLNDNQFRSIEVADVDGDNLLDVAYSIMIDSMVYMVKSGGNGTFSLLDSVHTPARVWSMSFADVSGDNVADLAVNYQTGANYLSYYVNNGDGSFGTENTLSLPLTGVYSDCILARIDADNNYDLVAQSSSNLVVWKGDGASGFTQKAQVNTGVQVDALAVGNLDNQGNDDIAWIQGAFKAIGHLSDTADYAFDVEGTYNGFGDTKDLVLGDFDEDGQLDAVVACYTEDYIAFVKGQPDGSFGPYPLRAYGAAQAIVAGNFDGDNHVDLVVGNDQQTDGLAFMKGVGDGTFENTVNTDLFSAARDIAAADIDGDTDLDILIATVTGRFLVEHNDGFGNFSDEVVYNLGFGGGTQNIAVGDFNNDIWPDAVVSNENNNQFLMYINMQTDTFSAPVPFATGTGPRDILAVDLNDDQFDDVITANFASNNISVFINNQSGGFAAAVPYVTGAGCTGVTVADFNHDEVPDIATVNNNGASASVLLGNGNGTFQPAMDNALAQSVSPGSITTGLVNNDTIIDLVVVYAIGNEAVILTGNGDGTFASPVGYPVTGDHPKDVALADFNEDNALDIATANDNTNDVSVILNNSAFITVTGSTQICEGESVTLSAEGGFSYLWSTGETTPSIEAAEELTYTVTITNQAGDCNIIPPGVDVTVNLAPTVTYTNTNQVDQCAYDDFLQLTGGLPQGGVYSGVTVVNGVFDPSAAGAGDHWLYYAYTDPAQCFTVTDSALYTVHPEVGAENNFPYETLCLSSDPIALTGLGTPAGGDWYLDNVLTTMFIPPVLGIGTYELGYAAENAACVDTAFTMVEVVADVVAGFNLTSDTLCMDHGLLTLTGGVPAGGTYFGSGVNNDTFDPIDAGAGTFSIGYGYDAGAGCTDTAYADVEVVDSVYAQLVLPSDLCYFQGPLTLDGGVPSGGTYFGSGVSNGEFEPLTTDSEFNQTLQQGVYILGYALINTEGCSDTAYAEVIAHICEGVNETDRSAMQVYPNPAENVFTINFRDASVEGVLEVRDMLGKLVHQRPINGTSQVNVEATWPAGNYQLMLVTDEFIGMERLMLMR